MIVRFGFCLLQYEHDPWLHERLNVGVLLFSQGANFLRLKTRGWEGRIFGAYPSLERSNFTEDLKQIERSAARYLKSDFVEPRFSENNSHVDVLELKEQDIVQLANRISPDLDSSYRWAFGGVGVCKSPDQKLEELFQRFVARFDKPKKLANRTDQQVWAVLDEKLTERNLDQFIETDKMVESDLGLLKFYKGYRNGSLHLIQPLSFDLADEENVQEKASRWGGYSRSVCERNEGAVQPHLVLGRPSRANLEEPFERAKRFLENMIGQENVVIEDQADAFVDLIERQLSHH